MAKGSASIVVDSDPGSVFDALADVTRMGDWSPECTGGRWVAPATGPAVGASFEGDNAMRVFGRPVARWTTTSEVTASEPGKTFEFVSAGYTTWRYDLERSGSGTKVTESFDYASKPGPKTFAMERLLRRPAAMTKGMQRTLERLKATLESSS